MKDLDICTCLYFLFCLVNRSRKELFCFKVTVSSSLENPVLYTSSFMYFFLSGFVLYTTLNLFVSYCGPFG